MEGSNLPYRVWAVAIYLFTTNIKGISSMKLHRELGISQKSAWFLLHRLRHASEMGTGLFAGPVEADEAYMGGKRMNMSNRRRRALRRDRQFGGKTTKTAVAGLKDRATRHVRAKVVRRTDLVTLQGFVKENTAPGASVYTDEAPMYKGLPCTSNVSWPRCWVTRGGSPGWNTTIGRRGICGTRPPARSSKSNSQPPGKRGIPTRHLHRVNPATTSHSG